MHDNKSHCFQVPKWDLCLSAVRSGCTLSSVAAVALPEDEAEKEREEELAAQQASWTKERIIAEGLVGKLVQQWQGPISTLARAGKAFEGLEALLGGAQGGSFDLGVSFSQGAHSVIPLVTGLSLMTWPCVYTTIDSMLPPCVWHANN